MKLRIAESDDVSIFADFIKDDSVRGDLTEDQLAPDDLIKHGYEYNNALDTRDFLSLYLEPLVDRIKVYPYVDDAYIDYPDDENNSGLSNYVRIVFKHPRGISRDEVREHYRYSIRFSDHRHEEAKKDVKILDSVEVVGRMPKNFEKAGIKVFNKCISDVERNIAKHETEKYGKQITFF